MEPNLLARNIYLISYLWPFALVLLFLWHEINFVKAYTPIKNTAASLYIPIDTVNADTLQQQTDATLIDTLEAQTALTTQTDTLRSDTLSVDYEASMLQALQDSIVLIEDSRIFAISGYIKPETQRPLPANIRLNMIEKSNVKGEHYFAILRNLMSEFQEESNLYSVADGRIKSTAYVNAMPVLESLIDYRTRHVFNSTYEADQFADTLYARFNNKVQVVLHLRSYDINLLELENPDLFDIFIRYHENAIQPTEVAALSIRNRVTDNLSWYERRIVLTFPRRMENQDYWNSGSLFLYIKPMLPGLQFAEEEFISFSLIPW